jgi:hypothetical protein
MANSFEFKDTIDWRPVEKLKTEDEILIGFPAGRPHASGAMETSELAKMLSYGTANIPARPFLEEGIQDGIKDINKQIEKHYKEKAEGGPGNLHAIAVAAVGAVRKFVFGDFYKSTVPNAPSTINSKSKRQKGKYLLSDKPLIDTGDMINSVTYVINGESK